MMLKKDQALSNYYIGSILIDTRKTMALETWEANAVEPSSVIILVE